MSILGNVCEALGEVKEVDVGHPDCDNCAKKVGDTCGSFRSCLEWREWFSHEWNGIRAAAKQMRENRQ